MADWKSAPPSIRRFAQLYAIVILISCVMLGVSVGYQYASPGLELVGGDVFLISMITGIGIKSLLLYLVVKNQSLFARNIILVFSIIAVLYIPVFFIWYSKGEIDLPIFAADVSVAILITVASIFLFGKTSRDWFGVGEG